MKKYCTHTIPYNDKNITYGVDYKSFYNHFNTFRTCNYIFSYLLIQYKKICLLESDIIVTNNIDDIFKLKAPSILIYNTSIFEKNKNKYNNNNILENYKYDSKNYNFLNFDINGGCIIIKPSMNKYNLCLKKIKQIIEKSYIFPNESLFLLTNKIIYNLPYKYNSHAEQYELEDIKKKYNINDIKDYPIILHFKCKIYKHIDIIKDGYLENMKIKKYLIYYFLKKYKKEYYDKYSKEIEKIIKS
jgi:hypothetical protein